MIAFFHLLLSHLFLKSKGGIEQLVVVGGQLLSEDQVSPLSGVSLQVSLQPPGLGFTANPLPISLSSYPFHPPLCGLFSHGQNATKLDQGSRQVFSSMDISLNLSNMCIVIKLLKHMHCN